MPARTKKSWSEKLNDAKDLPKVVSLNGAACKKWGAAEGSTLVVPAPLEVDAQMRRVPKGKLVTINELRAALARKHHTTLACPLCTGIFAWIAAHAAAETLAASPQPGTKKRSSPRRTPTPYWRTLKAGGEINPKFPGGPRALARLLKAEGHKITKRGNRHFVDNYEKSLAGL